MTDEATPGETESGEPETPDPSPDAAVPAVPEEAEVPAVPVAAVAVGPAVDARAEARKTRFWLPLLLPLGAVAVVAFVTLNVSRVFLAASESSPTPAVIIASVITLGILIGATVIAAFPDIRTSSLVVGLSSVMVVVLLGGSLVLGASEPHGEASTGFVEPAGPAINTLEVDAFPDLRFQAKRFDVPAGINLIKYIDKGGAHTLVFDDNAFPGFRLAVPTGKNQSKVEFAPEETYVIYCDLPGHRAAGMEAEIVSGAESTAPAEPGTETPSTTLGPGTTETTIPAGTDNPDGASQSSTGGT